MANELDPDKLPKAAVYFQNKDCPYFPCSPIAYPDHNCKFCYCPLFWTDCSKAGGRPEFIGQNHLKDCSKCTLPHTEQGARVITKAMNKLYDKINQYPEFPKNLLHLPTLDNDKA